MRIVTKHLCYYMLTKKIKNISDFFVFFGFENHLSVKAFKMICFYREKRSETNDCRTEISERR